MFKKQMMNSICSEMLLYIGWPRVRGVSWFSCVFSVWLFVCQTMFRSSSDTSCWGQEYQEPELQEASFELFINLNVGSDILTLNLQVIILF